MIFCTINEILAYGNLSGYGVKGHHACPIYEKDTSYIQLKHGKKIVYTGHQRFLKPYHPYRRLKKTFNGSQEIETDVAPCGACRPWIFFINGVLCFLKINGSGM